MYFAAFKGSQFVGLFQKIPNSNDFDELVKIQDIAELEGEIKKRKNSWDTDNEFIEELESIASESQEEFSRALQDCLGKLEEIDPEEIANIVVDSGKKILVEAKSLGAQSVISLSDNLRLLADFIDPREKDE